MKFMGYMRPDGQVGTRNYVAVIPSVFCAAKTAERIAGQVQGAICLRHPVGCTQVGFDFELSARTLIAMGRHPNIAAVLVVGLGCERFKPAELYEGIKKTGKPVEMLVIQDENGTGPTIEKGVRILREFAASELGKARIECDVSQLTVALKCGGTDATSGLAANPTLGVMSDMLTGMGGSAILSELNELLSTEDMLAARAINKDVAKKIYDAIYEIEDVLRTGCDDRYPGRNELISPGNFQGGVSSIVEKALGGVHKSGTSPIVDVLDYAIPPEKEKRGMFLMKYESQDGEVVTGMVGCGAQIVAFTTGRGNPTGFPFVPVIKVTGNDFCFQKMKADMDFNAAGIILGTHTIRQMGEEFFNKMIAVASGEPARAELLGGDELFVIGRRQGRKGPGYSAPFAEDAAPCPR
ncbi:MAG: UxaA family hydrolase [Treponema sp.]|jgi:altronate dehydratase large subunit|nr:UxaA family hydrolase [Treponema sp.]